MPGSLTGDAEADRLILQYGRPFVGIKRPEGFSRGPRKECYLNSYDLITIPGATYCEGFAIGNSLEFHHAWITCDGEHAIDVTLPDGQEHSYFGIEFRSDQFEQFAISRMTDGYMRPILGYPVNDQLRNFPRDIGLQTTTPLETNVTKLDADHV